MIPYLPEIYPDELVYSWFCRCYVHLGYFNHNALLQELYCKRSDNPSKEFIGNLKPGAREIIGQMILLDDLVLKHTMYPQYARFIPMAQKWVALHRLGYEAYDPHHLFCILPRDEGEQYLRYVGLDEWAGLGRETRGSCVQVMQEAFYEPAGIDAEHMCIWDGLAEDLEAECRRMEAFIEAHGPIALTLLGIGMNGHVGFNEPYTNLPEGCVIFPLDETTRKVSVKYFDTPLPVTTGVGVGAGELIKAKRILLMANGVHKAEIIQKTVAGATPAVPSSLMFASEAAELYVDAPAAEHLK